MVQSVVIHPRRRQRHQQGLEQDCSNSIALAIDMVTMMIPQRKEGGHQQPSWWRHQMETFSALLAICAGNSPAPMNSPHKGQWCGALMFTLICARINGWANNREAGDLRRHRAHFDVIIMVTVSRSPWLVRFQRLECFYAHGFASLNFVVGTLSDTAGLMWFIYAYSSGLLHWHWGNHIIAPVHVK